MVGWSVWTAVRDGARVDLLDGRPVAVERVVEIVCEPRAGADCSELASCTVGGRGGCLVGVAHCLDECSRQVPQAASTGHTSEIFRREEFFFADDHATRRFAIVVRSARGSASMRSRRTVRAEAVTPPISTSSRAAFA